MRWCGQRYTIFVGTIAAHLCHLHREAGTPTHELQRLGGWKTQYMVERYAHVAPEGLQLAASRLNAYLGNRSSELITRNTLEGFTHEYGRTSVPQ